MLVHQHHCFENGIFLNNCRDLFERVILFDVYLLNVTPGKAFSSGEGVFESKSFIRVSSFVPGVEVIDKEKACVDIFLNFSLKVLQTV